VIDERFTAIKIIGAVVTMAGVALAQFGSDLSMVWKRRNQSVGISRSASGS
jgi:hypothetical protein